MLPEWFDPIINTSLATGLIGFLCWGAVRIVKFAAPKCTAIAEGHVDTMRKMTDNSVKQNALAERQTDMLNAVVTTQVNHTFRLDKIETAVGEIHTIIKRPGQ